MEGNFVTASTTTTTTTNTTTTNTAAASATTITTGFGEALEASLADGKSPLHVVDGCYGQSRGVQTV
jgi:hypothetical protein